MSTAGRPEEAEVLVVTRQYGLRWGGGEHSLAAVVEALQAARPAWRLTVTDGGFDPPGRLRRLPLLQLLWRRRTLAQAGAAFHGRLALVQSLVGPALLTALPPGVGRVLFVRDVLFWDQWPNHEQGLRRLAKGLYQGLQAPAALAFRRQMRQALAAAPLVVANSAYMAGRLTALAAAGGQPLEPLVVFPLTPVAAEPAPAGEVVGVVGDSADKGGLIVRALARRLPERRFRVHTRHPPKGALPPNLTWAPWQSDPARLYHGLRLMLMPSQIAEGYGRVALEAQGHGVPVLVSRIGGLPETVPGPESLVSDYTNPDAWASALVAAWESAPARRADVHAFAQARRTLVLQQHQDLVARLLALAGEP